MYGGWIDAAERERMHAVYDKLQRCLDAKPGPSETSAAWQDFRRERFTDPGLEGLTGPAASYHLQDAARILVSAVDVLAGAVPYHLSKTKRRPRYALDNIMRAHGYRYLHGVQAVEDAIVATGHGTTDVARFREERAGFEAELAQRAAAAHITNDKGECPAAVVRVVRIFVAELRSLARWLESYPVSTCPPDWITEILDQIELQLAEYAEQAKNVRPPRSRRGARRGEVLNGR
jgi:hypothetical protein